MNGRRAAVGLALLCALMVSAFAASNASAKSTTAYTCVKSAEPTFDDAHCLSTVGVKEYKHVAIIKKTNITGTNANTAESTKAARVSKLKGVAAGLETEVQCTEVSGTGTMENQESAGEMFAAGTGTITYKGCTVQKPAGKSCVVKGGEVKTKELAASTKGLTNQLAFTPASGTEFASITIESCTVAGLNQTFPVVGSLKGKIEGATTTSTHTEITEQGTLKFAGQKAGLDGALTLKGENGSGLAVT